MIVPERHHMDGLLSPEQMLQAVRVEIDALDPLIVEALGVYAVPSGLNYDEWRSSVATLESLFFRRKELVEQVAENKILLGMNALQEGRYQKVIDNILRAREERSPGLGADELLEVYGAVHSLNVSTEQGLIDSVTKAA